MILQQLCRFGVGLFGFYGNLCRLPNAKLKIEMSQEESVDCCDWLYQLIGQVGRVFANSLGDLGSIPGRVIPKTFKMVLDTSLLNTQQYKVCIKGKWSNPEKGVGPSPTPQCCSNWKGAFGSPTLLLLSLTPANHITVRVDPGVCIFISLKCIRRNQPTAVIGWLKLKWKSCESGHWIENRKRELVEIWRGSKNYGTHFEWAPQRSPTSTMKNNTRVCVCLVGNCTRML